MAYDVEKLHRMENALRTTACLVGKPSASLNEDGFKVGLGLTNEADICQNAADAVKEGVFKAIVIVCNQKNFPLLIKRFFVLLEDENDGLKPSSF